MGQQRTTTNQKHTYQLGLASFGKDKQQQQYRPLQNQRNIVHSGANLVVVTRVEEVDNAEKAEHSQQQNKKRR